ncbi:MAG: hypothetical protein UU48_C0001G0113 [Candidatus Uhrbacteria bacterium GW2011_GWF2_41_16]|uniref:Signal peptidase I n=2 Tax=Candidatus Uhriibacteriota TaxID=1752732 RepID=A0A0G0VCZ0_9BACT|nr:MAG: hypothetical protein UU31_C0002G0074 [Candidatus Uhrbacteria bacterium GW2011_GWA2_41_10]KKR87819.1 MAG: hypothetical protein UU35_C0001G0100 [Candidatus Uhrbacteria bacterium GW2011_GWC2_41_11]KKR98758.1 MAG: hypothetical protein UU48_C0001G0113 [Candidatus Uhrbacteria bacterium GW2011_GWF2_41_16]HBP00124.1 signal peptidase I [Candidatus Uhrbacteria bacterium]
MSFFHGSDHTPDQFWHRKFGPVVGAGILFVLEIIQILVFSAAIIIPIRYFLIQPFYVKGASMEPNFYDHEYLLIDEISYRFREPKRGDIIVFRYPRNPSEFFIKRVVGLPGETVEILDGVVTLYNNEHPNGIRLEESYLSGAYTPGRIKYVLGSDEYIVLGDNRDASLDSRAFGPVKRDELVGRVWIRGLPLNRAGIFETPEYPL